MMDNICVIPEDCITVTVKTKNRYKSLINLCMSIHKYHSRMRIVVADEIAPKDMNKEMHVGFTRWRRYLGLNEGRVTWLNLSPGVGYGRKTAVILAETKYVMIADDDFLFTKETNLQKMLSLLERTDVDIVGGAIQDRKPKYDGIFHVANNVNNTPGASLVNYHSIFYERVPQFDNCYACDRVKNFFLADRDRILQAGSWDAGRRFYEHEDVFLQMRKSRLKVVLCSDIKFIHNAVDRKLSNLRLQYKQMMLQMFIVKWKFAHVYDCKKEHYFKSTDERTVGCRHATEQINLTTTTS